MKLADVKRSSKRLVKYVTLRIPGLDEEFKVGMHLLSAEKRRATYKTAKERALKDKAVEKWDQEDPICQLELCVETVAACSFDADSDPDKPEPWATAEELRSDDRIGQDNLMYLYEAYQSFESANAYRPTNMTAEEFVKFCYNCAGEDDGFLDRLRPGIVRSLLRTMARRYLTLMTTMSLDTTVSE